LAAQFVNPFDVSGEELDLDQAEAVKEQGVRIIEAESGPFEVNLAGLQRANSVTVAVLMAWYRHAALSDKSIKFVNLSRELLNIIEDRDFSDSRVIWQVDLNLIRSS